MATNIHGFCTLHLGQFRFVYPDVLNGIDRRGGGVVPVLAYRVDGKVAGIAAQLYNLLHQISLPRGQRGNLLPDQVCLIKAHIFHKHMFFLWQDSVKNLLYEIPENGRDT